MTTQKTINAINNVKTDEPKYKSYVYIYNFEQAYFYIRGGVTPNHIDVNGKTGRIFFRFLKDETFNLYKQWNQLNK